MTDTFIDPENGKPYIFAGRGCFEVFVGPPCVICGREFNDDKEGFMIGSESGICGACGGGYGRPANPDIAAQREEHDD